MFHVIDMVLLMRKTGAMWILGGLVNLDLDLIRGVRVEEGGDARKGGKRIGIRTLGVTARH